jgi:cysteine-rich repeat protein
MDVIIVRLSLDGIVQVFVRNNGNLYKIIKISGNGIREQWEECDDGNLIDNDGCSNC